MRAVVLAMTVVAATSMAASLAGQTYVENIPIDHPSIQYRQTTATDRVARLSAEMARGDVVLDFRPDGSGFLASVLAQLGVAADSQALVFSKTSMQADRISPRHPRAIYFADDVAVGFVPGGAVLELAAVDPRQGVIFYALQNDQPSASPLPVRRDNCLQCHQGPATAGVPGIFISSVYPSATGLPSPSRAIVTDHRTAFEDRWGGWYVNGNGGNLHHRGNSVARNPSAPEMLDSEGAVNAADLHGRLDPDRYVSPVSDIVALLTLEHQTQMTNLLTRTSWMARIARDTTAGDAPSPVLQSSISELVAYMLFVDEPPLPAPIEGASSFTRTFAQRGPRDRRGRSLRDFDLTRRLFRYPLSYMVYSAAFDALPAAIRERVYRRLFDVLTGKDSDPRFARLSADDRSAILDIVRDTKSNLPPYWSGAAPNSDRVVMIMRRIGDEHR